MNVEELRIDAKLFWRGIPKMAVLCVGYVLLCVGWHCIWGFKQETSIVSCILAGVALLTVWAQVRRSRLVAEAELIRRYNQDYFSPKKAETIRLLFAFGKTLEIRGETRKPEENNFLMTAYIDTGDRDKYSDNRLVVKEEEDSARRAIKGFFFNVLDLYLSGAISKQNFNQLCDKSAIRLMFDVIEPMERCMLEKYDNKKFYMLMKLAADIYKKYETSDGDRSRYFIKTELFVKGNEFAAFLKYKNKAQCNDIESFELFRKYEELICSDEYIAFREYLKISTKGEDDCFALYLKYLGEKLQ